MQENPVPNPPQPDNQTPKQVSGSANDRKSPLASGFRPPEQALNCPRCDSPNTKFCYYNNYSLTQPRHFCKTCRRYWTKGGALRNVPIGGGSRKNKRSKSAQRTGATISDDPKIPSLPESAGGKYFPAIDFGMPFSRLQGTGFLNNLISFGDLSLSSPSSSSSCSSAIPLAIDSSNPVSMMGFNYPVPLKHGENGSGCGGSNSGFQGLGSQNLHGSIAASIESLSTINADLHWKLQQQRLAMFFGGENRKETGISADSGGCQQPNLVESQFFDHQEQEPMSFQNLQSCKNGGSCNNSRRIAVHDHGLNRESATEWLFESSYNNSSNNSNNCSTWSGIQTWTDLQHYSALP